MLCFMFKVNIANHVLTFKTKAKIFHFNSILKFKYYSLKSLKFNFLLSFSALYTIQTTSKPCVYLSICFFVRVSNKQIFTLDWMITLLERMLTNFSVANMKFFITYVQQKAKKKLKSLFFKTFEL